MALHKDEAIVLFKRSYGESDKIIRLFTMSSGKVAAIAKGANKSQKRFANTLEPFNRIRVEYFEKYGRGMVRIENADIIETNSGIETSLRRACTAGFFVEFVDRLTKERERHDDLFNILAEILQGIRGAEFTYDDILYYQLRMLEILGFMPNFHACVYCGQIMAADKRIFFSRERGGILCHKCAPSLPHQVCAEGLIEGIVSVQQGNGRTAPGFQVACGCAEKGPVYLKNGFEKAAQDIMEGFMTFHLDVEFKSYRILKGLIATNSK